MEYWKRGDRPPSPPIPQSPNHPIIQSPNPPIAQSPNRPIIQSPNHPIPQSPNHPISKHGLTLIELLVATAVFALIVVASMTLVSACLQTQEQGESQSHLYREGLQLMDRMTARVRSTTCVLVPNAHNTQREMLLVSDLKNDDNDFYFDDPLFPRVDEDAGDTRLGWGKGLYSIDDNGDGTVDNSTRPDDDEDGLVDEDPLNGLDDDGDGNVDEDWPGDINADGSPGIVAMDDDGDGQVDEASSTFQDDDEDGFVDEDEVTTVLYTWDSTKATLTEIYPSPTDGIYWSPPSTVLATNVTHFKTNWMGPERIQIELTLRGDAGETATFVENVYVRNALQRIGKRVR